MAKTANTFVEYDAVGNREDLSDMIWDVSPFDTPVLSAIKKNKARGVLHEWQNDALAVGQANAVVEGNETAFDAVTATTRLNNYTQILDKSVAISGTQEAVNKAGRKSEIAYQTARRLKEIKLDLEWAMLDGGGTGGIGNAKVADGDGATAREMGSIQTYLITNGDVGAGAGAFATGNGVDTMTAGTARDFTEALLTTTLQECYTSGGDPKLLVVSPTNKGVVSTFTGGGTHYVDKDDKKLINSVDVYVGDFHTLKVVPSRQMANEIVLCLDPEYLAYSELRPVTSEKIAKDGDAEKRLIVMEGTLEVCNEKAHGIIADTNG